MNASGVDGIDASRYQFIDAGCRWDGVEGNA
jgi:hypothetical protein